MSEVKYHDLLYVVLLDLLEVGRGNGRVVPERNKLTNQCFLIESYNGFPWPCKSRKVAGLAMCMRCAFIIATHKFLDVLV